ncbi:AMP-binding protein [Streptomyces sp. NPDC059456]|uniref:AMP-binding protein n=1 Tax=Streptomyces sp. NPDC059456 TaxID=3346838 RepID=UPI0036C471CB
MRRGPLLEGCTPWPEAFVDRYWAAGHWRGTTLDGLLRDRAIEYGPRTALVHGSTRLTYAALNRRVDRMAAGFRLLALRPGQRVVVQLPNVPEFVVTVFALLRVGAVPVLCPLSHRAPEVSHLVRVTEARGYVGPATHDGFDHTAMAAGIAAGGPFLRRVFTLEAPGTSSASGGFTTDPAGCHYFPLGSIDAPPAPAIARHADGVALLLVSGGGAGAPPRLVPRTHNDYAYQARAAAELVSPRAPAGSLDALPAVGADPGSLRLLQVGGAPLPRATAERIGPELGCRLQQVSGRAEGLVTLTRPADPDETVLTTLGRPLSPDDELRLVGADGAAVPCGESGELLARGPYTVRGYYRAPGEDARSFTPDGWFRTGVRARLTPDGDLVAAGPGDPSGP